MEDEIPHQNLAGKLYVHAREPLHTQNARRQTRRIYKKGRQKEVKVKDLSVVDRDRLMSSDGGVSGGLITPRRSPPRWDCSERALVEHRGCRRYFD